MRLPWWVPYETGYAKMGQKGIASLLLKEADEFSDYLKIEKNLYGFRDLADYVDRLAESTLIMGFILFEQSLLENRLLKYIKE